MIKSFFKTAWRTIWKGKSAAFLNIFGLGIGIACSGLIFLWMEDEVQYDATYEKKDRIARIIENQTYDGKTRTFFSTPGLMGPAVKAEIPGIANACRFQSREVLFSMDDKGVYERGGYADSSWFSMFKPVIKSGNTFSDLKQLVISQSMAGRFFGKDKNIIGRSLKLDNKEEYVVTGVMEDIPANSTIKTDWLASFDNYYNENKDRLNRWGNNSIATYVELEPAANTSAINKQLFDFISKKESGATAQAFLFAMKDWRLRDQFEDGKQTGGRVTYVRMFSVIAWIILLIACINFMNLATARSEKRAREVGVRKVLGAGKRMLILQFLGEAFVMAMLAAIAGVLIILVVLPSFNLLVEKELTPGFGNPIHIGALLGIVLLCGIVAGSYPALYLSSYNPVSVLKTLRLKSGGAVFIRKGLVILQFTVSIVLIISTIVIFQQIQHVKGRDMGYQRDGLLSMTVRGEMRNKFQVIKQDLQQTGLIENAALNSYNIFNIGNNTSDFTWQGKDPNSDILISARIVSPEFISTLGMHIAEGRDFNTDATKDSTNAIITSSFAAMLGKGSAIGKTISYGTAVNYTVVGVVNDMVYGDMYTKSDPVIFVCSGSGGSQMYVRPKSNSNMADVLDKMAIVMKKNNPAYPFEYRFVEDQFNEKFKSEMLISKLSRVFALLAIIISCLGLFGLSAFTAEKRTKEIGIRKVLGASTSGLAALLSKDFLQLVAISCLIAFPLAWWAMNDWLRDFGYRISLNIWVFIAAGLAAIIIALVTVSFQAIRTALLNPVRSLRSE